MKQKLSIITILTAMLLLGSCNSSDNEVDPDWEGYVGTETFVGDVETFTDYVLRAQHIRTTFLRLTSDGFTPNTPLLMGDWLGYMKKHPETVDELVDDAAWISLHEEEYVQAIRNLENKGIFSTVTTKGILSDLVNSFLVWKNEDKIYRNKLMSVYDKLSEQQKQEAFDWIDSRRRGGAKSKEEWADMIRKGKLDSYACHYYKECYQGVLGFEDYVAPDETPLKLISESGLKYIQAAAAVEASAFGTFAPGSVAAGTAMAQLAEDGHDLANAKDGAGFLDGVIKVAGDALGSMGSMVKESVTWSYDAAQAAYYGVKSYITGDEVESPQKDKGAIQVKDVDKDKNSKTEIIIAQKVKPNPKEPSIHIGLGAIKEGGEYVWNAILKAGEWFVTAIDKAGNMATVKVNVEKGKITPVTVETKKIEKEEDSSSVEEAEKELFGFKISNVWCWFNWTGDYSSTILDSNERQWQFFSYKSGELTIDADKKELICKWNGISYAALSGNDVPTEVTIIIDRKTKKLKSFHAKLVDGAHAEEYKFEENLSGRYFPESGNDGACYQYEIERDSKYFTILQNSWINVNTGDDYDRLLSRESVKLIDFTLSFEEKINE